MNNIHRHVGSPDSVYTPEICQSKRVASVSEAIEVKSKEMPHTSLHRLLYSCLRWSVVSLIRNVQIWKSVLRIDSYNN